jgi:hypothetical protein
MNRNSMLLNELKAEIKREFSSTLPQSLVEEFKNDSDRYRTPSEENKLFFEIFKQNKLTWPELSEEQIHGICEKVTAGLIPSFSNAMYAYYLPAFLMIILDGPKVRDAFIWDSIIYSLMQSNDKKLKSWQRSRWATFNNSQARLILRFLSFIGSKSAREEFPRFQDFSLEDIREAESVWTEIVTMMGNESSQI